MFLDWYMAGPDAAASYKNLSFRVHKATVEEKYNRYEKKGTFGVYQLQVRELGKIQYKDLGYKFYTDNYPIGGGYYAVNESIDEKIWTSIDEIVDRVEEILISLDFLPSKKPVPLEAENGQLLRGAAKSFITALKYRDYLRSDIDDSYLRFLEDMFLRGLSHYLTFEKDHLFDKDGNIPPIKQAEFEIDLVYAMAEPTMYFEGGWPEGFWNQSFLHDEKWLEEYLNEEFEEVGDYKIPSNKSRNDMSMFVTNKFKVTDEVKLFKFIDDINQHNRTSYLHEYEDVVYEKYEDDTYLLFCEYGEHLFNIFDEDKELLKDFQSILPDGEVVVFKDGALTRESSIEDDYDFRVYLTYITNHSIKEYSIDNVIDKDMKAIKNKMNKKIITTDE